MEDDIKEKLTTLIEIARKQYSEVDVNGIVQAFDFARIAHVGEKRLSGEEFIIHPLETATFLARWKLDASTVMAGLLHDTVEHGAAKREDIEKNFGHEVLALVDGVTKVSKVKLRGSTDEEFVDNLRRMFLAMAQDLRVVLLRFAERIDNLRTLVFLPDDERVSYAKESLEIFSPLAERLDIWYVKTKIDELAFKHAYPSEYTKVKDLTEIYYKDAQANVDQMKSTIEKALKAAGIEANVYGRKKGLYSIYNKLKKEEINWDIKKIYDVVALRIIVDEVKACYQALGIVHSFYKPVPHIAISDFISTPKPNGYQSIHTKVFGPDTKVAEVQIRTYEMHEQAEFGTSSHIGYVDAKKQGVSDEFLEGGKVMVKSKKLAWVRQLATWQKEIKDSKEFLKAVKFDALSRRIFVFSPAGDVYDLPEGATPIDYAYAVHTRLGYFVKSAKVDGKIVPLDYKLQSSQIIEIDKVKAPKLPNKDWLDFVITHAAASEIKKQIKKGVADAKLDS